MKINKLPEFESLEEMGEFWDTHDFVEALIREWLSEKLTAF
jgi:hypothetical protein